MPVLHGFRRNSAAVNSARPPPPPPLGPVRKATGSRYYAAAAAATAGARAAKDSVLHHERKADAGARLSMGELSSGSANATVAALVELALQRGEGVLSSDGALLVDTRPHTGRSSRDKFIVREPGSADLIWWQGNQAMSPANFQTLQSDMLGYLRQIDPILQDLEACAAPSSRFRVRVVLECAWHGLAIRNLLRVPTSLDGFEPDFTVLDLPGFQAVPERHGTASSAVIAISIDQRLVLIAGTRYSGEIKKAVFTLLNALLPDQGVMPMHCSANHVPGDSRQSAVFFGLSGTGKTTLSSTRDRTLIGDDEHGWSADGLFNLEGGCYAKTFRLSAEGEPEIFQAANGFGSVLENVCFDPRSRVPDFDDDGITENGRSAYPLAAIRNASATSCGGEPGHVVMLACDAFSVLPPIARLSAAQAEYYFLSGFTAKVAGTERGVAKPAPTFSACFGAPFLPRPPVLYGRLFHDCLERRRPACWMVNTGWLGGGPGAGRRMPLQTTRALLSAALSGALESVPMRRDPRFGFLVPVAAPGVDPSTLDSRASWSDGRLHDEAAQRLVGLFRSNFKAFEEEADTVTRNAGPAAT